MMPIKPGLPIPESAKKLSVALAANDVSVAMLKEFASLFAY
jgi:D-ribose pyranose/furanose isomerase RbsD